MMAASFCEREHEKMAMSEPIKSGLGTLTIFQRLINQLFRIIAWGQCSKKLFYYKLFQME
jgi:hypothetical protein